MHLSFCRNEKLQRMLFKVLFVTYMVCLLFGTTVASLRHCYSNLVLLHVAF